MGQSTDGQICYGIKMDEGDEHNFPWYSDKYDGDIEEWWLYEVHGYKNPFELYDHRGEWIDDIEPPQERIDEYYDKRREFRNKLPKIPIEEINYCSGDYPIYILAIPTTCLSARRGYPEEIPMNWFDLYEKDGKPFFEFIEKYIDTSHCDKPKWYLSSYWG